MQGARYVATQDDKRNRLWRAGDYVDVAGVVSEAGDVLYQVKLGNEEYEISQRLFHIVFQKVRDGQRRVG